VIHCVGPFQGQDYRVAHAALAAGAHYIDLADGRDFVANFGQSMQQAALRAGRVAVSGASTLPALSSAVLDEMTADMRDLEEVHIAIAPGQRAPRGAATLAAVFSYLGRPVRVWQDGVWKTRTGWMDLRRVPLSFGSRCAALCDVPDLALLPKRYPSLRTVRFHAALEFGIQHFALWMLAALRRSGVPLPMDRWAGPMNRAAALLDPLGGEWGGMWISAVGEMRAGRRLRRTWQLTVPANDGPEIPCIAAILMAQRIGRGEVVAPGAAPCMGYLKLADFQPAFARWGIQTQTEESSL
jgi:hypothetical protein